MKKLLFIFLIGVLSLNSFGAEPYFFVSVRNGDLVPAGSTSATPVLITDALAAERGEKIITYTVEVVSGTIKFGVGSIGANSYGNPVGAKRMITCKNGELYFQAASGADTFVITGI